MGGVEKLTSSRPLWAYPVGKRGRVSLQTFPSLDRPLIRGLSRCCISQYSGCCTGVVPQPLTPVALASQCGAFFPRLAIVVQALCHCRTTGVTPAVRHQLTIENSGHTPDPLFRLDLLAAQVALSTLSRRDHFVFQNAVVRRSKVTFKRSATKTVVLRKSANQ